jgi:hypothetical protein
MIIHYMQKPTGQMDEVVSVARHVKPRDLQCAAVILDFKQQQVIKCSMQGTVVPKDWNRILAFYYQYYKNVMDGLAKDNNLEIRMDKDPREKNHTD